MRTSPLILLSAAVLADVMLLAFPDTLRSFTASSLIMRDFRELFVVSQN